MIRNTLFGVWLLGGMVAIIVVSIILSKKANTIFAGSTEQEDMVYEVVSDPAAFFSVSVDDIDTQATTAIAMARQAITNLIAVPNESRTYNNTIRALDVINDTFSRKLISPMVLSMVSPDEHMRTVCRSTVERLQHVAVDIFKNPALYQAFRAYQDHCMRREKLSLQERYYLDEAIREFEREGFALPKETLESAKALQKKMATIVQQFEKNIADDGRTITVTEIELAGLTSSFIAQLKRADDDRYVVGCDYPTYFEVMENCRVATTRKQLYLAFNNRGYPNNVQQLEQMIALRDAYAKKLNFASFAHLDLDGAMAKSPDVAEKFIHTLLEKSSEKEQQEFAILTANLPDGISLTEDGQLEPWDVAYVKSQYKQKYLHVDEHEIAQYFPLDHTLQQLFKIYESFFSIRFKECRAPQLWHKDVRLIEVYEAGDSKLLGKILLDLYPRPHKYTHACHVGMVSGICYRNYRTGEFFQRPSMSLVIANFTQPSKDRPSLLKHREVRTFFHEFGHALHQVLGRAEIASLAGTATKTDFVEMPSQMLENWLWKPKILELVGAHYKTGKPLPDVLINRLIELENFSIGFFLKRQCLLALVSLYYFSEGASKDTSALLSDLWRKYITTVRFEPRTHFQASFGHLMGYGSKYYSYLWSQVYARDLFALIEEHGLLDKNIGKRYREEVLGKGGAQNPMQLITKFLGRPPQQDAFLQAYGLA